MWYHPTKDHLVTEKLMLMQWFGGAEYTSINLHTSFKACSPHEIFLDTERCLAYDYSLTYFRKSFKCFSLNDNYYITVKSYKRIIGQLLTFKTLNDAVNIGAMSMIQFLSIRINTNFKKTSISRNISWSEHDWWKDNKFDSFFHLPIFSTYQVNIQPLSLPFILFAYIFIE